MAHPTPTALASPLGPPLGPSDRFERVQPLGQGATSVVYRTSDRVLGREVALKVLRASLPPGTLAARRFEREARLVARLDHPRIVQIWDTGWLDTRQPWLALELVHGETLEAALRREQRLPLERGIAILSDVLDALAAAHARDVLHRDLKPANLMLSDDRAKLLDFGVCLDLSDHTPRITAPMQVVGTMGYLAPEQLVPDAPVDARADLWAAGVVLYRTLTGQPPFGLASPRTVARTRAEDPPPPTALVPELPPAIDAFVRRALAKDPAQRFASALEMRAALLAIA